MTPEEYFKKWKNKAKHFKFFKAIHSHEDMMQFAKDYHEAKMKEELKEMTS